MTWETELVHRVLVNYIASLVMLLIRVAWSIFNVTLRNFLDGILVFRVPRLFSGDHVEFHRYKCFCK